MEIMQVPEARDKSIEATLHQQSNKNKYILFEEEADSIYKTRIAHRAIGVVYHPLNEKRGNYVPSMLNKRYNALIYFDETRALHPLHMEPHNTKTPETYPFGV